jgi:hypothetical protein
MGVSVRTGAVEWSGVEWDKLYKRSWGLEWPFPDLVATGTH